MGLKTKRTSVWRVYGLQAVHWLAMLGFPSRHILKIIGPCATEENGVRTAGGQRSENRGRRIETIEQGWALAGVGKKSLDPAEQ